MIARGRRRPWGQSLIEFALIMPVFIGIALGVLDFGRLFYYTVQFDNGLREAARYAAKNSSATTTDLTAIIVAEGNIPSSDITAVSLSSAPGTLSGSNAGNIQTVTATYSFHFISPWLQNWAGIANPLSIITHVAAEAGTGI
jgi:Flp pilus assembly protein TadG